MFELQKLYPTMSMQLLEYDRRFDQYGSDFTFYDYNVPEDLPEPMKHAYQIVVADPPYLVRTKLLKHLLRTFFSPLKTFFLLIFSKLISAARMNYAASPFLSFFRGGWG